MTVGPGVGIGAARADAESDASVIARSRDDPEAFAVLFDRHADAVHRYVARRLGGEVADDLVAETFTTAFQQRHRYDPARSAGADARPWLLGIATNLVTPHLAARTGMTGRIARHSEVISPIGVAL
ncbi:sigma factor, partial [Streptomyces sp. NPDC044948]|uniref:RNA polymerase sigma factor n=1 Tax=Streptomyces sp. NPDC044948 TaxID=3157092 RepID=UPI0033FD306F